MRIFPAACLLLVLAGCSKPAPPAQPITYTHPRHKFSLTFPPGWKLEPDPAPDMALKATAPERNTGGVFGLKKHPKPPPFQGTPEWDAYKVDLRRRAETVRGTALETIEDGVISLRHAVITTSTTDGPGGKEVVVVVAQVFGVDDVYTLALSTEARDRAKMVPVLMAIVQSLQLP